MRLKEAHGKNDDVMVCTVYIEYFKMSDKWVLFPLVFGTDKIRITWNILSHIDVEQGEKTYGCEMMEVSQMTEDEKKRPNILGINKSDSSEEWKYALVCKIKETGCSEVSADVREQTFNA